MKTESQLRRMANKEGLSLHKSRASLSLDNQGGYQVIDTYFNKVEYGKKFELSLEDVEEFLTQGVSTR